MKNYTTPRSLTEASFTHGYTSASYQRQCTPLNVRSLLLAIVTVAACAAIGAMLAWRG